MLLNEALISTDLCVHTLMIKHAT